jgi:hypothetical protein
VNSGSSFSPALAKKITIHGQAKSFLSLRQAQPTTDVLNTTVLAIGFYIILYFGKHNMLEIYLYTLNI